MSIVVALLALCLLLAVLQDAFEVVLLPRRVYRRMRLTRYFYNTTWRVWMALASMLQERGVRERFLAVYGPLSLVVLFSIWAGAMVTAFGCLHWASTGSNASLADQLYMSGVTFFTLGYGDAVPHSGVGRLISVIEAGTGIGFIAIGIAYLPVLYQLFARREAHVIQLDARAGSPPTATTMLARHAESGGLHGLEELLRTWEIWASDLLESHLSYPMLVYYRSQHDNQSWLAALTAVMDCCALVLVGVEDLPPLQARMTFATARHVVVELAKSFDIPPSRYAGEDRLPPAEFRRMAGILKGAGITWIAGQQTEDSLAALRATYEPLIDGLGAALHLDVPEWIAAADAADNWERGPRGIIAGRMVEQLSERTGLEAGGAARQHRLAQRLLARLSRR